MIKLIILEPKEHRRFNSPPFFNLDECANYKETAE